MWKTETRIVKKEKAKLIHEQVLRDGKQVNQRQKKNTNKARRGERNTIFAQEAFVIRRTRASETNEKTAK